MLWLVDLLLVLLALGVLGLAGWGLWKHVRVLLRAVSQASEKIGDAMPPSPRS